ncbi:MAG: hypothetical protein RG740_05030, partial [Acholeplasmataceae bacterium]|nr:hypothetical protein [Acholeplasmataceae bacterium]
SHGINDHSGTLGQDNGGTGYSGGYTNGQLLIGGSTLGALVRANLTAGTNISITNGEGSITINNTYSLPAASQNTRGGIKVWSSGGVLYIET